MTEVTDGKLSDITPDANNANLGTQRGLGILESSLRKYGAGRSILLDREGRIIAGNKTVEQAGQIGLDELIIVKTDGKQLVAVQREDLDLADDSTGARELAYADNRVGELDLSWNSETILADLDSGVDLSGLFREDELNEILGELGKAPQEDPGAQVDKAAELQKKWGTSLGQIWELGEHRLACGDCTDKAVVEAVMRGELARMIFTDPPYGIGKDIENDNLKREAKIEFYRQWTNTILGYVIENAYVYVWGYFDTLSDYWQEVIKPRGDCNFRNFIIWQKTFIQGRNAKEFRQFPEHYEACLLFIFGQPFQNGPWSTSPNAEYYPEMFETLRAYLDEERKKMGWDIPTVKKMVGHSDLSGDHWFNRSQWSMPTQEVYEILQTNAKGRAFRREYDDMRREYDDMRGHFDNTNGFTDLWQFDTITTTDLHPTVKPVEVCERGIMTTSQENEIVLDSFLGSGSTLLACEQLGRKCRGIEIDPGYVGVTLERWHTMTGKDPVLING